MSLDTFFEYVRPRELDEGASHHPVIVVGAGPVGLSMALDWARHGHDVLILAAGDSLSEGSRAICFAKRTLEICDRLGFGDAVADKGVSWNVGKVFRQDGLLYDFNLLPDQGHRYPAFVNLQQYYFEHYALAALAKCRSRPAGEARGAVQLRWGHRVVEVNSSRAPASGGSSSPPSAKGPVEIAVGCADGIYRLTCDWLVACDGAGSPVRKMLGLSSEGQVFRDRFLIADVKIRSAPASMRNERWFWFDPPFHRNQSALLHRQADNVWRLDFQLGWESDPELERMPERVLPRVRAMLAASVDGHADGNADGPADDNADGHADDNADGHAHSAIDFDLEWVSVYTFQCRRMERFTHGHVIFAGDAAHQVSPFGARGANSGIQDVDNLAWKLDLVVRGLAPETLLATYDTERIAAADENILNSTRSTDFITPKSDISRTFRDAVLELAAKYPFARKLVNSGRLSVPSHYAASRLNTADIEAWPATTAMSAPGSPALDAPLESRDGTPDWLLRHLGGRFSVVVFVVRTTDASVASRIPRRSNGLDIGVVVVTRGVPSAQLLEGFDVPLLIDREGLASSRYAAAEGDAIYLFRPDQHVAGRRSGHDVEWLGPAVATATGNATQLEAPLQPQPQPPVFTMCPRLSTMPTLNVEPNLSRPDDFYESLIALHRGLAPEQSAKLNARLILLLANHIGDAAVLDEALQAAAAGDVAAVTAR